ncbi:hypothetical protein [Deminuibacter soli]|uniref:CHAT domain-containing protein n=1 Tax=Deminuibacter soli TaxID=2291815 RepID=A0A3E1NJ55_9BACT|nr:hypothetical protein [Deminuibacter soli]RFM27966.1 hypothetical protein DXN05_10500 [Deminuibacter soli]
MRTARYLLPGITTVLLLTVNLAKAQQPVQEAIDRSQKQIATLIAFEKGSSSQVNAAITTRIDSLQTAIPHNSAIDADNQQKYLAGLHDVLNAFIADYTARHITGFQFADLLNAYSDAMQANIAGESIAPVIAAHQLEPGNIVLRNAVFAANSGIADSKGILALKEISKFPGHTLQLLNKNPNLPGADSLLVIAAHEDPDVFYNYAAATNAIGQRIKKIDDPLVQLMVKMAAQKTGRQYFPFLDDLYRNKQTFAQITKAMQDKVKYYKLLVKTQIAYAARMAVKDTPLVAATLTAKLQQTGRDEFLNTINGLHESPDGVRFRKLEQLTPQELYYLAVLQEEEIYTSSYTHGVYPMIFRKMKKPRGDTLLMQVHFDHFKKWIKMAANFNTLNDFLKRMEPDHARLLMKAFVKGLDKTNNLEDAVDVANSYASITDSSLRALVLQQVQENLHQAEQGNKPRMKYIYSILNTLFLSIDPANKVDLTATLNIPPVYSMPNNNLHDSAGRIIVQQFFYGDADGKAGYVDFVQSFTNNNWEQQATSNWIAFSSKKGTPLTIYANKPRDEEKNLDADAQNDLVQYLKYNHLKPSVVIHRGHSYYLNSTIEQLAPSAKLIMLGSCGAYQSLNKVLNICPQAQIIASKQTGTMKVNQPMIDVIINDLREGKDLEWPQIWKGLSKQFKGNELFDDYVPPYKNLGAVFIIAYQKASGSKT